jgi:hypothetical protein
MGLLKGDVDPPGEERERMPEEEGEERWRAS